MTGFMTAVIGNKIEVLADRATYDSDGIVLSFGCKIRRLPHAGVMMTRGLVAWAEELEQEVSSLFSAARSFDEAVHQLERRFETEASWDEPIEATICGFDAAGPIVLHFLTAPVMDFASWSIRSTRLGTMDFKLMPPDAHSRICGSGTLADKAVFLMEELRSSPGKSITWEGGADHVVVGGGIDLATLTPTDVSVRTLHTWPDRIGEALVNRPSQSHKPSWVAYNKGAAVIRGSSSPQAQSRQQRRAMARKMARAS